MNKNRLNLVIFLRMPYFNCENYSNKKKKQIASKIKL